MQKGVIYNAWSANMATVYTYMLKLIVCTVHILMCSCLSTHVVLYCTFSHPDRPMRQN